MQTTQTPVIPIYEVRDYDRQIRLAAELLRQGKIIVLPTETVYGAVGLLRRPAALAGLNAIRGGGIGAEGESGAETSPQTASPETSPDIPEPRGRGLKPFVPHVVDRQQAAQFLGPVPELGQRMMKKLWPGPVALVFEVPADRRREVAASFGVAEGDLYDGSIITLRCPDHFAFAQVLAEVNAEGDEPVVAVRAGIGSTQPAHRAQQVAEDLGGKVDLIIDAGPTKFSKPSTVIRIKSQPPQAPDGKPNTETAKGYEIIRAGVYDERIIEKLMRTTILFVCTGNTCRSPMAEALARRILAEKLNVPEADLEKKGVSVASAGSSAMPGSRATPEAVDAVRALGVDLASHRSRPLTVELINQADLIFTMSRAHAQQVRALVPSVGEKVDTLAPGRDIDDPIGGEASLYNELAGELRELIEQRLRNENVP